jgi:hypothetical protein
VLDDSALLGKVTTYEYKSENSGKWQTFSRKGVFRVGNGSVTPREEGSAKQTQVMLLGGWSAEDVA